MNAAKLGRLLIAGLVILATITNFANVLMLQVHTNLWWKVFLVVIGSLFFVLNIASAFGLLLVKQWGFWLAYVAIIFSTIFFATSYVPLIDKIFTENIRYLPMIGGNLIVLAFIVYLHFVSRRNYC